MRSTRAIAALIAPWLYDHHYAPRRHPMDPEEREARREGRQYVQPEHKSYREMAEAALGYGNDGEAQAYATLALADEVKALRELFDGSKDGDVVLTAFRKG